jgi:hypothetical protein
MDPSQKKCPSTKPIPKRTLLPQPPRTTTVSHEKESNLSPLTTTAFSETKNNLSPTSDEISQANVLLKLANSNVPDNTIDISSNETHPSGTPVSVPSNGIDEETLKLLILSKRESNYKNAIDNNFIKRDISLHYRIILDLRHYNSFEEQVRYLQQYFSDINH